MACHVCLSKEQYTLNDGTKVCKYGHQLATAAVVAELDFYEERVLPSQACISRSMNRTKYKEDEKIIKDAKIVLFQKLLQFQLQILVEKFGYPLVIKEYAHDLWMIYLDFFKEGLLNNENHREQFETLEKNNYEESDVEERLSDAEDELQRMLLSQQQPDLQNNKANTPKKNNNKEIKRKFIEICSKYSSMKLICVLHIRLTIVIIYLACLYCRLPVMMSDIFRLAKNEYIPYLSAASLITEDLKKSVSRSKILCLRIGNIMFYEKLTCSMVKFYQKVYRVEFPEINIPLILYRMISFFELPYEMCIVCLNIIKRLSPSLCMEYRKFKYPPSAVVLSVIMVVLKIEFGFDNAVRKDKYFNIGLSVEEFLKHLEFLVKTKLLDNEIPSNPSDMAFSYLKNPEKFNIYMNKIFSSYNSNNQPYIKYMEMIKNELLKNNSKLYANKNDHVVQSKNTIPNGFYASFESSVKSGENYVSYNVNDIKDHSPIYYHEPYARLLKIMSDFIGTSTLNLQKTVQFVERLIVRKAANLDEQHNKQKS